ncbi:MAG: FAD-dependent oxidoreductase [Kiritimatiellaceae bacterium]|nr:FAD-dependent oxidoreductase [Kiritimatiellaceae bacterium]
MKQIQEYDFVVVGGGMAGVCAAIAAARQGLRTCLVHERPVLGGVASSETRVTIHGAACHHAYARETGIIHEILEAERQANHETINETGWTNSIFDMAIYDLVSRTPNLTLHLNTCVVDVLMDHGAAASHLPDTKSGYYLRKACATSRQITAVVARTLSAELELELRAPLFADCTGDGFIADQAGCEWRMGSESQAETGEVHAPQTASTDTMGSTILLRGRDMGHPCPFQAPDWAVYYDDADFFYKQGRPPSDPTGGYWWIEIGIPWHTIHENETIRRELTRHALGVWDWMKNRDPRMKEACKNFALDFIGQVPGKRESRRVVGRYWLTENDIQAKNKFPDEVAYGGWFVDLHTPGGLLASTSEPSSAEGYSADSEYQAKSYVGPYGIPLRSLIARDVDNLMLAGRCISVTRAALGTVRVMATTALMGQAIGTAAGLARARNLSLPDLAADAAAGGSAIREIQQQLLRDGCFLPNLRNTDASDIARLARVTASSSATVSGVSPLDQSNEAGLTRWLEGSLSLDVLPGQLISVSGGRIDRLGLCLNVEGDSAVNIPVRLVRLTDIFDYRTDGAGVLAEGVITAQPGESRWVWWDVSLENVPDGYVCLQAGPCAGAVWRSTQYRLPGHSSRRRVSPSKQRSHHHTLSFQIEPVQAVYEPASVLSGRTRPGVGPECWRSAPDRSLPQWLELAWDVPQTIKRVELTFPGQMLLEVHSEPPFYRASQNAREYSIEVDAGNGVWNEVVRVRDNWNRRRNHDLPQPVTVKRLRVLIQATGGDPSAAIAEIRCYAAAATH